MILKSAYKIINNNISAYLFFIFFIIGAFFFNTNQESVLYGSTLANFEKYYNDKSFLKIVRDADITFQIYFPHILSKLNIGNFLLDSFFSGLTVALSMISFYTLSLLIGGKRSVAIIIPIIFLGHNFINTRWYGIHYPTDFFFFGQTGMYLLILSTAYMAKGNKECGLNLLIINLFCHAAWGLLNIFFIILYYFYSKKTFNKYLYKSNIILLFLLLLVIALSLYFLKLDNLLFDFSKTSLTTGNWGSNKNFLDQTRDVWTTTHNLNLIEDEIFSSQSLFNYLRFSFFDIVFLTTIIVWWNFFNDNLKKYLKILTVILIFIYLLLFFYDYIYNFFQQNLSILAGIFDRIIISRYLNLINIITLVLHLNIFFSNIKKNDFNVRTFKYHIFLILVLILIAFFYYNQNITLDFKYSEYINIYNVFIWILIPFNFVLKFFFTETNFKSSKFQNKIFYSLVAILLVIFLKNSFYQQHLNSNDKLLIKNLSNSNRYVLLGGFVYGNNNFLNYIKNPLIVMLNPQVPQLNDQNLINIFCNRGSAYKDQKLYFHNLNSQCFAKKTISDWKKLKKESNVGFIVMPKNYPVQTLQNYGSIKNFIIYRID